MGFARVSNSERQWTHCFHHTRFFLDLRFSEVRYAMDRPPCQRGISPMVNNGDASLTTRNQTCAEMWVARFKEFDNALSINERCVAGDFPRSTV
jgi:hypothetical protein